MVVPFTCKTYVYLIEQFRAERNDEFSFVLFLDVDWRHGVLETWMVTEASEWSLRRQGQGRSFGVVHIWGHPQRLAPQLWIDSAPPSTVWKVCMRPKNLFLKSSPGDSNKQLEQEPQSRLEVELRVRFPVHCPFSSSVPKVTRPLYLI